MQRQGRRAAALVASLLAILIISSLGVSALSLMSYSIRRGERDALRARAIALADAGIERAINYLMHQAPDGSRDGSWRTQVPLVESIDGVGLYAITVTDGTGANSGRIVVESAGVAVAGDRSVTRRVRLVLTLRRENVSVWGNAIFAGVGQAGKSINGNVAIRGKVHLLGDGEDFTDVDGDGRWDAGEPYTDSNGNGKWDPGEPYTDSDGDGRYDAREPFEDVNGNGTRDPALTVTDLASEINGDANMANNYQGMPALVRSRIPDIPTAWYNGELVQSLSAILRVKHGRVNISGSASVGYPDSPGGTPPVKETMDATYVSDGWGGNKGAASVYSDNGSQQKYDLGDTVEFPVLTRPYTINGVTYRTYLDYLQSRALVIPGPLDLIAGVPYGPVSDGKGNYFRIDATGTLTINGIVYVTGDVNLKRGILSTFVYNGGGTLVSTGSIYVSTNLLPTTTFPTLDRLGMIARRRIEIATGSGDSQLSLVGAFYAQERILCYKQNEIAGTFVSSYFEMKNVPRIYQVPELDRNLPPGMPASDPIWVRTIEIHGRREI